jgi:SAM-dependent methyltransferase
MSAEASHHYDNAFYRYITEGSLRSARLLIPALCDALGYMPPTVLDVGCGAGAWLAAWKERGAVVFGVDGVHVSPQSLLIEPAEFLPHDLRASLDLGRRFSLIQCLEVAEHLPGSAASELLESICRHGDVVMFSAAPPGQGGEFHVNERPYGWWQARFAASGFRMYDPLRAELLSDPRILPWYRYNTFVFVREGAQRDIHERLARFLVAPESSPLDLAPLLYRLRRRAIAVLPVAVVTRVAILKKHLFNLLGRS